MQFWLRSAQRGGCRSRIGFDLLLRGHGEGDQVPLTLAAKAKAALHHACFWLMSRHSSGGGGCGGCAAAAAGWRALRPVMLIRCARPPLHSPAWRLAACRKADARQGQRWRRLASAGPPPEAQPARSAAAVFSCHMSCFCCESAWAGPEPGRDDAPRCQPLSHAFWPQPLHS